MIEDYRSAQRAGQRAYRANVARGQSPYLAVLDDILTDVDIVAQEPLGLVDIPAESIVGTKTAGRHTAFASNFMPLLDDDTEFAVKWSNLCDAHLEEGIHTPIIAFEYLNKFYVQEGNKRVSVLKYYEAVKIPGTVTRLIPAKNDTLENKLYYEFLDFYKLSRINYVGFSRLGGYAKLQALACKATGEMWTEDDRLNFSSLYTMFSQQFYALGGGSLGLTPGDALLVYLLSKLNIFSSRPSELRVVFLHEHNAQTSAWVRGQDKGRAALVKAFPDKLYVSCRENINPEVDAEQVLEEVAHDHADIVFTTSARMHTACLKVAAQHPKTRFLNCSLSAPHPLVRTYYPRTYEVTYLLGMLAGIVSHSDKVGYVAANPVYGVPAAINAFAQGVRAVRPDSRVVLRWACLCDAAHPQDFSDRKDIEVFYSQDFREPEGTYRDYGLCRRLPDGVLQPLGLPEWRWDVFFTEIVRSVFAGTWDSAPGGRAINYWWGLKSGAERVEYPTRLNDGTMQLLKMAERQLCDGEIQVFPTESYSQGHVLHHAASGIYTPKELMEMDWLEECVEGELPSYDELDAKTRSLLNVNGLDIVKGTPQ